MATPRGSTAPARTSRKLRALSDCTRAGQPTITAAWANAANAWAPVQVAMAVETTARRE